MATSLFRLGRLGTLKCLQQDGWGSVRTPLTAAFCTKTEAPKKPAKKASTLEAPDERAALLAHKTTVAFPSRLSTPGLLGQSVAPVGGGAVAAGVSTVESAPSTSHVACESPSKDSSTTNKIKEAKLLIDDSAKAEIESCDVGAAADATTPSSADVEAQKYDNATSSSSSSSSDSDSDSDSDDEKPKKTDMTKTAFLTKDTESQKKIPLTVLEKPATGVKTKAVPEHVEPSVPDVFSKGSPAGAPVGSPVKRSEGSPVGTSIKLSVGAPKIAPEPTYEKGSDSCQTLTSSEKTTVLCATPSIKLQAKAKVEELKSSEVSHAILKAVSEEVPETATESTPKVVLDSVVEVASEPKVEPEVARETTEAEAAAAEVVVDAAPVITKAEEVQAEPAAAAPEEAPSAPAPEPEPFDNTTYKNLQHHNYNIYTFVDMDVEMAKSRLPQPSTGRLSPRH